MPGNSPPNSTPPAVPGTCPVCGHPAWQAACGECGWVLATPLRAGPVTPERRESFAGRLSDARGRQARWDGRELDTGLRAVVSGLRPRGVSTVIDVGLDEIAVCAVYLDPLGAPRVREAGKVTWTSALRDLPGDERDRYARLAHGIGGRPDDEVAGLVLDRLPPARRDGALVICRPAGWRLPETVARALATAPGASVVRVSGATSASARGVLEELASREPLRYTCHLMTAAIDRRTGRVTFRPRPLLPAGPARKGSLTVWRPPGKTAETILAIFAGADPLDRAAYETDTPPAALYSVPLPPGPRFRVRAVIDGPGRLRITEPRGAVPHQRTWAEVRDQLPGRVALPVLDRVDLVCAVDMAGDPDTVRRRVDLVRDFVELLAVSAPHGSSFPDGPSPDGPVPDGEGPRFGLVTCTDHVLGPRPGRREDEPVTRVHGLGTARDALAALGETPAARVRYPGRAPVEDLLHDSLRLLGGSRAAGRLPLLLTVAGRLPHPPEQSSRGPHPCPRKYRWSALMDELITGARALCRVVADTLPRETSRASPAERDERAAWRRLGPGGQQYTLKEATARGLAEGFGVLPPDDHHLSLPLADGPDDPEGDAAR